MLVIVIPDGFHHSWTFGILIACLMAHHRFPLQNSAHEEPGCYLAALCIGGWLMGY